MPTPKLAHLLAVLATGGAIAAIAIACDDEHKRTPPGKVLGGGGACEANPGQIPKADCDNSDKACSPVAGCVIDEAKCGSTSTCLPLSDNKGKDIADFRLRRLNIAAPAALASTIIQTTIVNSNLELSEKSCAENGTGNFTWLVRVDRKAGTIVTGGAPPTDDGLGKGFCFASFEIAGRAVTPLTAKIELSGNTFRTTERADVNIPIFTTSALTSAIVLPIRGVQIEGVTLTEDGNCIGSFVSAALDQSCTEDRTLCPKWQTAGALGGYITLEDADSVHIKEINKSLCSYLSAETAVVCGRDPSGQISFKGDFCSKDYQAGSCQDSVWLAATFAASAAKIFDGKGSVDGCSGVMTTPDAGSSDAGAVDAADQ